MRTSPGSRPRPVRMPSTGSSSWRTRPGSPWIRRAWRYGSSPNCTACRFGAGSTGSTTPRVHTSWPTTSPVGCRARVHGDGLLRTLDLCGSPGGLRPRPGSSGSRGTPLPRRPGTARATGGARGRSPSCPRPGEDLASDPERGPARHGHGPHEPALRLVCLRQRLPRPDHGVIASCVGSDEHAASSVRSGLTAAPARAWPRRWSGRSHPKEHDDPESAR